MARAASSDNPWPEPLEGVPAPASRRGLVFRQNVGSVLILLAGVALAALLFAGIARYFGYAQVQRIDLPAQNLSARVAEVLKGYGDEVRALAAFYSSSPTISRREFTSFVQRLSLLYPYTYNLQWVPRVRGDQLDELRARARNQGLIDFEVLERTPSGGRQPVAQRETYFPTLFVEPYAGNEQIVGLDQMSESIRAAALNRALATQGFAVSGRMLFDQGFFGVIGYSPVLATQTEEVEAPIEGAVAGVLNVGAVIDAAVADFRAPIPLDIYLYDLDGMHGDRLLYFRPAPERGAPVEPMDEDVNLNDAIAITFSLGGRTWALAMRPIAPALNRYEVLGPYVAAGVAMLIAILLASVVAAAGSRASEVEKKVRDRTRELRESEEQIRLLANSLPAMIMYFDTRHRFRFVNQATERWLASDRSVLIGKPMEEVFGQELFEFQRKPMDAALRGDSVSTSAQLTYPDGKAREVETIYVPHQSPNGRVLGVYALALDVSDRRRLERELENFFSLSLTPLAIADFQGRFRKANAAWCKVTGYTEEELLDKTPDDLAAPEDRDRARTRLRELFAGKAVFGEEMRVRHKSGTERVVELMAVPQIDERRIYMSAVDITERRRNEQEIRAARAQALAAARSKTEFLANMSHEIRTPLNAVLGFSDLVLKADLSPRQRDYVRKIKSAGEVLLELISGVLDLSKIESGKLELEAASFDLSEVMDNVAGIVSVKAAEKDLDVFVSIAPDVPLQVVGDSARLSQVLVNLIGNALKFTMAGEVFVRVSRRPGLSSNALRFEVTDTGIGLSKIEQERLFQPFVQADASTTRRFGGTGLGLAISRQLVEAMGGQIGVDSAPGHGSMFWFTAVLPADRQAQPKPTPDGYGRRIVLADVVPLRRKRVLEALAEHGAVVSEASTLPELEAALQVGRNRPNAVVIDFSLGADAVAAAEKLAPEATLVILADTTDAALIRGDAPGFIVLTKPLDSIHLQRALFGDGGRRAAPIERSTAQLVGARVLLVEDNEMNQEVAIAMLMAAGASVDVADNGREGLRIVDEATELYDAVLMDVQMPEMDGVTATIELRKKFNANELPIIAMTAHAFQDERDRCLAAGMNDYLTKPVTAERLTEVLAQWTVVRKAKAAAVAATTARAESAPAAGGEELEIGGLAAGEAMRTFGFSRELFTDLLGKFHHQYVGLPLELETALAANDGDKLMRLAHTVRGSAGYVGAADIKKHAAAVEESLREGKGVAFVAPMVAELRSALKVVLDSTARFDTAA